MGKTQTRVLQNDSLRRGPRELHPFTGLDIQNTLQRVYSRQKRFPHRKTLARTCIRSSFGVGVGKTPPVVDKCGENFSLRV